MESRSAQPLDGRPEGCAEGRDGPEGTRFACVCVMVGKLTIAGMGAMDRCERSGRGLGGRRAWLSKAAGRTCGGGCPALPPRSTHDTEHMHTHISPGPRPPPTDPDVWVVNQVCLRHKQPECSAAGSSRTPILRLRGAPGPSDVSPCRDTPAALPLLVAREEPVWTGRLSGSVGEEPVRPPQGSQDAGFTPCLNIPLVQENT